MYLYQDTNNLFHVGSDILPAGKYILQLFSSDTIVSIITADTERLIMDPILITDLQKEDDSFYVDLDELLTAIGSLFAGGGGGSGASTFIELTDTPGSFSGQSFKTVRVNSAGDATEFVDAGVSTIGSEGDYATVSAAITAGKYDLKLIGNVVETGDITINGKTTINLGGYDLDLSVYQILGTTYNLLVSSGSITFAHIITELLFSGFTSSIYQLSIVDVIINNNSTITEAGISCNGYFLRCKFNLPNFSYCGLGYSGNHFQGKTQSCEFIGGGVSCERSIYTNAGGFISIHRDVTISGTWSAGNALYIWGDDSAIIDGIICLPTNNIIILAHNLINGTDINNRVSYSGQYVSNCRGGLINGSFANSTIVDCVVVSTLAIIADNVSFINNTVTIGTITVDATADKTNIISCRTFTSIVDNGTNTIVSANQLL